MKEINSTFSSEIKIKYKLILKKNSGIPKSGTIFLLMCLFRPLSHILIIVSTIYTYSLKITILIKSCCSSKLHVCRICNNVNAVAQRPNDDIRTIMNAVMMPLPIHLPLISVCSNSEGVSKWPKSPFDYGTRCCCVGRPAAPLKWLRVKCAPQGHCRCQGEDCLLFILQIESLSKMSR